MSSKPSTKDETSVVGQTAGRSRARLLLVEQFFYPEGWGGAELPRDLAVHLARHGNHVEVICGTEQYAPVNRGAAQDPRTEGVTIHRVPPLAGRGDVHARRAVRQLWFCGWAALRLFFRRPPDLFVSQTNPPLAVPLVALAALAWRKPFLLIAMDLYPEVMIAHGVVDRRGMLARLTGAIFGWAYRSAARVVALGPVMAERIRAKGVTGGRIVEICNWATGAPGAVQGGANRLHAELGLGDSLVLVYSGNLGLSHECETLLRGFAIARQHVPSLRLLFFGSGTRLDEARQLAGEFDLGPSVTFSSFVPSDRLPETLGLADLGVVTLREGFEGLVVPSKLMGYMSRGIPVLYIGPRSDVDLLVSRHDCGFSVRNGDPDSVARTIIAAHGNRGRLSEMGQAGLEAYESALTREHGLLRYELVVQACLDAGR